MNRTIMAKAVFIIDSAPSKVWAALVKSHVINSVDINANDDWQIGCPVTYTGKVLQVSAGRLLVSTFLSSLAGLPDVSDDPKIVRYDLSAEGTGTRLTITFIEADYAQDVMNNAGRKRKVLHAEMEKLMERLSPIEFWQHLP